MVRFCARLLSVLFVLLAAAGLPAEKSAGQAPGGEPFACDQEAPYWYGQEWTRRQAILVATTTGGTALSKSAIKIALNGENFDFDLARTDGGDIRFTNSDGKNELYYWIEEYDSILREAGIWVRMPDLPDSSRKAIYLYYGNPAAISAANRDSTFMYFHEDFSSLRIDWENDWDTDDGEDLSKRYYHVDRSTKGYLVRDRKSFYADTEHDYFKQQVAQIIRPYTHRGFWDSANRNWIRALRWNSANGWTADAEPHDWIYSVELEEGALMAASISKTTEMDSLLAGELRYVIDAVDSTGALQGFDLNRKAGSYGIVLSVLALGSVYFKDHHIYRDLASEALDAMNLMYVHISKKLILSREVVIDEVIILRGLANAAKAFKAYGREDIGNLAQRNMEYICQKILSLQLGNGYIYIEADANGRIQKQLKTIIALELAYSVNGKESYLKAVERNLGWIIDNRFDRDGTGGIEWPPGPYDGNPFFEVHQVWFMIAAGYYADYTDRRDQIDELNQAFAFLTDDNYAQRDMYEHNLQNYDAFFSYRVMERNGVVQDEASDFKTFKGAYEIGASLWALALHYDTYNRGYARLTSRVPCDSAASFENGGMFTQDMHHQNYISWNVRFRNPSSAGMYSGLFRDKAGTPIILFDSMDGLNYMSSNDSVKVVYAASLIKSRASYTVRVYRAAPDSVRILLLENGNEVVDMTLGDVAAFEGYYFGLFKEPQKASDAPASFFIDTIHIDQYAYPEPSVVVCP